MEMRFFGLQMLLNKENTTSNIFPGKKILQITRVSTTLALTTWQSVRGIFTKPHQSGNSLELVNRAL